MPTDVMSASCHVQQLKQGNIRSKVSPEIKSGYLVLVGPGGIRQDVRVVVYRTTVEHFSVIYPRKKLSKPMLVLNLRSASARRAVEAGGGFIVRPKGHDHSISIKFLCAERDVESWLTVFTSQNVACQHLASLPVLIEGEES